MSIFREPSFWDPFEQQVRALCWKCDFSPRDLLLHTLDTDASLYADPSALRHRRRAVLQWQGRDEQWAALLLGAVTELAWRRPGPHSHALRDLRVLDALADFVEHLDCFYSVAARMGGAGLPVTPLGGIHDLDKLDPWMLVGYSERFEDGVGTALWEECVGRHVRVNAHHQGNGAWSVEGGAMEEALREMVCDKVSRRLQKDLGGRVSPSMWEVEGVYFEGLPTLWINRADKMMKLMKEAMLPSLV